MEYHACTCRRIEMWHFFYANYMFSLRRPVGLGNDEIGLQYFKIDITIEELKFAYFYGEICGIPYHSYFYDLP